MRRALLATVLVLAAVPTARAQFRYETVSFEELLGAHVKSRLGIDRLPSINFGKSITEPAVYVTATRSRILLYGETIVSLSDSRVPYDDVAICSSGATCIPRLRDALIKARSSLGHRLEVRPAVLLLIDRAVPFDTLLLVARSAAEAGAPLSMQLVGRRGPELIGLPVWVAPGRTLVLSDVSSPRLITVEVGAGAGAIVRTVGADAIMTRGMADLLSHVGQLQLSSGRNTYFLAGSADTPVGKVVSVAALVRDIFPNVVLHERGQLKVLVR